MKIRKILIIYLILIMLLSNISIADDRIEENLIDEEILSTSTNNVTEPQTFSKHIICIERNTNRVLYEKDAYTKTPMASTTKIMTAIVVLEKSNLSEEVEISSKAANTGGSTLGITAGNKMTMEALLYGLMLRSRKRLCRSNC